MSLRSPVLMAVGVLGLGTWGLLAADTDFPAKKYDIAALRKKLAYVSLADRLQYETDHVKQRVPAPKDSKETFKRLETRESEATWFGEELPNKNRHSARAEALRILHTDEVDAFIKRAGFGRERIRRPDPYDWELVVGEPVKLKKLPGDEEDESAGVELPLKDAEMYKSMRWPTLAMLGNYHHIGSHRFLDPMTFGHVKDRTNVSGFLAHHIRHSLGELQTDPQGRSKERWVLQRLELVSLLKHDTPQVYLSDALPRMDDLKTAKTRDLNAFEDSALKAMARGEDLVAEASTNRIQMMGSLRAGKDCLKCHEAAQRGDLLGTFSYELRRDPALAVPKK